MKIKAMKNSKRLSRRHVLKNTALGSLLLGLSPTLFAQQEPSVSPLGSNLSLLTRQGRNVVVAVGNDAVVVVDGGHETDSAALMQEINNLAQGKPVTTLFNTNWRPEHCGLNYLLGPAGATIIAHENTRLWQNNDFFVAWENRQYHPMPKLAQANKTYYKTGQLTLDGAAVEYGTISQFHTDGDMYIHFKDSNVLVVGDMLTVGTYPLLDYVTGGWIGGAQESTRALLELADADTLIIPASGEVQGRAALEAQLQMLDHAYDMVANAYRTGRSLDQFMATSPMADYADMYGNADLFTELLYRSTWYHVTSRAVPGII